MAPRKKNTPVAGQVNTETGEFKFGSSKFEDADALIADRVKFNIVAVEFEVGKGFEGADRWNITIDRRDGGETTILSLPSNEKRDEVLSALNAYLTKTKKPYGPVVLGYGKGKEGTGNKGIYFNDARPEPAK